MNASVPEPVLRVRPRPAPFYLRRPFLVRFVPVASLALAGVVALIVSGTVALPFQRLVVLDGVGGSKIEYLSDPEVIDRLLTHHIAVHGTRLGSRESARVPLDDVDFVFPSGQPAATLVAQRRQQDGGYFAAHRVFVSPIVLATYREYAETLRANGIAAPQAGQDPAHPYYYDLDIRQFIDRGLAGTSWDELGIAAQGLANGNTVLAQTSDVCTSNSAATYLGLVAYVVGGGVPAGVADAAELAGRISPLLRAQGQPTREPEGLYLIPEGREIAPVLVLYEHQYLAHQLQTRDRTGRLDEDRVLLYPSVGFQSEPTFIALNPDAERLAEQLTTDPVLRRRALELGYRVLDASLADSSVELPAYLGEHGVPAPAMSTGGTRARLPEVPLLEAMINTVGGCPP